MRYILKSLLELKEYNEALGNVKNFKKSFKITGLSDSQKAHITYALSSHTDKKAIYVANNELNARRLLEDFKFFTEEDLLFYPSKELVLHDVEARSQELEHQRINILYRIMKGDYKIVVTSIEALNTKFIDKTFFEKSIINISLDVSIEISYFAQKLVVIGYERVSKVEGKGQFAIRGGIIDVFPINSDNPIRIELFGNDIDSLRVFDVDTQRSIYNIKEFEIIPAREIIFSLEDRKRITSSIESKLSSAISDTEKDKKKNLDELRKKVLYDTDKLNNQYYFAGIDKYISFIIEEPSMFIDYVSSETVFFIDDSFHIKNRLEALEIEHFETIKTLIEKSQILPNTANFFFTGESILEMLRSTKLIELDSGVQKNFIHEDALTINITTKPLTSYQGHINLLIEDLKKWKDERKKVIILAGTRARCKMLQENLESNNIFSDYEESIEDAILPGQIVITHGSMNRGFEYPELDLVIVSDKEIFGESKKAKKLLNTKKGQKLDAFTDLKVGDYVVHYSHGIGKYVGIEQLIVNKITKDYLKIQYSNEDNLYIPTSQIDLIQKYIGSETKLPKLNKLGGSEWRKSKARVKESVKELAEELIKLGAQREATKGHKFSEDTIWQNQMEETFPYVETDDQLRCIEEIKEDMEKERPMDRLLCGDVGYGKTEVALRAIFKAVMDGKQVAYLVPTTILAQQQYNSFKERVKEFPINIDVLSRFRTSKEQKDILNKLKAGTIDVIVGTHRLVQKDIKFKDLGLLVIDEEQRFGVAHKEKIKKLKANVDVLTLSATPIPRTLHMSLVGIRDISTIEQPPGERVPVQTFVMEYNSMVVKEAIEREMARNGQVFYLFNRVRTIFKKQQEIQELVPHARIVVVHGQMSERELEDIMIDFIDGKYDVLICTTIIESGLDMPNVNTIIIEDADKMGLAQLYQLRGRVGRSNKLGYAYVTYKKDKALSEVAEKRLRTIKEFTELGSGFKIAMRDLEIRGAGNLLGPQQHGQVESVGYDMYCRLLEEAVGELKGKAISESKEEILIDLNISAYIDTQYIGEETQKIEMYKKIATIYDERDLLNVEDELIDRYGDIPEEVKNLLLIAYIKNLAQSLGFILVQEKDNGIILQFTSQNGLDIKLVGELMKLYKKKLLFSASTSPYLTLIKKDIKREELLGNIKILLQDIKKLQEG